MNLIDVYAFFFFSIWRNWELIICFPENSVQFIGRAWKLHLIILLTLIPKIRVCFSLRPYWLISPILGCTWAINLIAVFFRLFVLWICSSSVFVSVRLLLHFVILVIGAQVDPGFEFHVLNFFMTSFPTQHILLLKLWISSVSKILGSLSIGVARWFLPICPSFVYRVM